MNIFSDFAIIFIIVAIGNLFLFRRVLKNKEHKDILELMFLVKRYKLDLKKLSPYRILYTSAIINALIISFITTFIVNLKIENGIFLGLSFIVAFGILLALIFATYEIYGRYLKNRQEKIK